MIRFITGKPGDGKSLVSTQLAVDDLVEGECMVVTNIPLNLDYLREEVCKVRGPNGPVFDLDERVRILKDEEVFEFYRFRSGGLVLAPSPDRIAEDKRSRMDRDEMIALMKTEFLRIREKEAYQLPVHYYIDEAHNFFSSRDWATNGRGTLYYASQHRHLHDEVFLITQVMENVEKQLRSLVGETLAVRNYNRRSIGWIKMRPIFTVKTYYGVPTPNIEPFNKYSFHLNPERIGRCYDTVGALGVHKKAEKVVNKVSVRRATS